MASPSTPAEAAAARVAVLRAAARAEELRAAARREVPAARAATSFVGTVYDRAGVGMDNFLPRIGRMGRVLPAFPLFTLQQG
jgi:hypothetical protein